MGDIYERLRMRLDEMATGYPSTASGIELELLRKLFTPETAREVALRTGSDEEAVAAQLEGMARKGLLFRLRRPDGPAYHIVPFIVGIYEFQVNALNGEILKDVSQYYLSVS